MTCEKCNALLFVFQIKMFNCALVFTIGSTWKHQSSGCRSVVNSWASHMILSLLLYIAFYFPCQGGSSHQFVYWDEVNTVITMFKLPNGMCVYMHVLRATFSPSYAESFRLQDLLAWFHRGRVRYSSDNAFNCYKTCNA